SRAGAAHRGAVRGLATGGADHAGLSTGEGLLVPVVPRHAAGGRGRSGGWSGVRPVPVGKLGASGVVRGRHVRPGGALVREPRLARRDAAFLPSPVGSGRSGPALLRAGNARRAGPDHLRADPDDPGRRRPVPSARKLGGQGAALHRRLPAPAAARNRPLPDARGPAGGGESAARIPRWYEAAIMNASDASTIGQLALLAALSDRPLAPEEQAELSRVAGRLGVPTASAVMDQAQTGQASVAQLAGSLSDKEARRTAYEVAVAICSADRVVNPREQEFLA